MLVKIRAYIYYSMCFAVWNYEEKQRVSVDYIMQMIMFLYFKLKFTHHLITVSKFLRTDQLLTSLPHARAFTVKIMYSYLIAIIRMFCCMCNMLSGKCLWTLKDGRLSRVLRCAVNNYYTLFVVLNPLW